MEASHKVIAKTCRDCEIYPSTVQCPNIIHFAPLAAICSLVFFLSTFYSTCISWYVKLVSLKSKMFERRRDVWSIFLY